MNLLHLIFSDGKMTLTHIQRFGLPGHPQDHPIAITLDQLLRNIDSLVVSFPIITKTLEQAINDTGNEIVLLVNSKAILDKEEENRKTYTIPPSIEREFSELNRKLFQENAATSIVPQSLLVALISQYDAFLGQLIRK